MRLADFQGLLAVLRDQHGVSHPLQYLRDERAHAIGVFGQENRFNARGAVGDFRNRQFVRGCGDKWQANPERGAPADSDASERRPPSRWGALIRSHAAVASNSWMRPPRRSVTAGPVPL